MSLFTPIPPSRSTYRSFGKIFVNNRFMNVTFLYLAQLNLVPNSFQPMSLTKKQREDLSQLSNYFKSLEKKAIANNIDLDVFMTEYKDNGYAIYATEQVSMSQTAEERKEIFKGEKKKLAKEKVHAHRK